MIFTWFWKDFVQNTAHRLSKVSDRVVSLEMALPDHRLANRITDVELAHSASKRRITELEERISFLETAFFRLLASQYDKIAVKESPQEMMKVAKLFRKDKDLAAHKEVSQEYHKLMTIITERSGA